MSQILVLHGPNLNMLGVREPSIYGDQTLETINRSLKEMANAKGASLEALQSNAEHVLVDRIHLAAQDSTDWIIINPAAFTHTSVALRDALLASKVPFIEVHLSNVHAREPFRHHSYLSDVAHGVIAGFGPTSYALALDAILREPT